MHLDRSIAETDPADGLLRALIAERGLGPGDRLPPERDLIEMLGVGRTALRRALDQMEREGLIWRHVGKGTFLTAGTTREGGRAQQPVSVSALARRTTPVKMMQARLAVEPAIAREAAINASADAMDRIEAARRAAHDAPDWRAYEAADDRFHRAVAEAADNLPLLAIFDQLNSIRRSVTWGTVQRSQSAPPRDHSSFAEHDRILETIRARDAEGAQTAMRTHLRSVSGRLFGG
ncbi:FadR family transcriptional regulator [Halovulum dunhuangense]|uniref:FadR family transcriptional regulator n=1 Tax=Halovulum dunhuangense TaxID=1505036 RepID=A0A849L3K0_9RHOB|nr:FCD domain-containing protein [Halovulum dunhuangense]NNU80895.1 FadR family transcriptional regulator [Halovulum dunhuangense]